MQKTVILVLSVLVLFMFIADASAKIIDVVHLKNGSVIQGTVTVINESIKIETDDGSTFIVEMSEVDKIKKIEFIKPKDPLVAVGTGCGTAFLSLWSPIPVVGAGQIYNGQYLKGVVFFGIGVLGWYLEYLTFDQNEEELGTFDDRIGEFLHMGSIVWSAVDSYYSAKKINLDIKKKVLSTTTFLNYIPNQGIMASYNIRF